MVSFGLHISTIACWADIDVLFCCMETWEEYPNHKPWVEILTVSLVPWYSLCLISHFIVAVSVQPILHQLKRLLLCNFLHYCFGWICITHNLKKFIVFFASSPSPPIFIPSQTNSTQRPLIQLFVMWQHLNIDCPFITLSNVPNKWHNM